VVDTREHEPIDAGSRCRPELAHPVGLGRIVHQRPNLHALRREDGNDQSGELPCRSDGQHSDTAPRASR
jgi:hypothetical protein